MNKKKLKNVALKSLTLDDVCAPDKQKLFVFQK